MNGIGVPLPRGGGSDGGKAGAGGIPRDGDGGGGDWGNRRVGGGQHSRVEKEITFTPAHQHGGEQ